VKRLSSQITQLITVSWLVGRNKTAQECCLRNRRIAMANDPAITHNDMLMSSDWPSFFADLARTRQGQPVTIEQDSDSLLENPAGKGEPLQGIEYRSHHRHKAVVITTAAQTYSIEAPNLIWAVRNEQGELVAVEISDAQAHEFVVRFV
jgi:hypothetical protein